MEQVISFSDAANLMTAHVSLQFQASHVHTSKVDFDLLQYFSHKQLCALNFILATSYLTRAYIHN